MLTIFLICVGILVFIGIAKVLFNCWKVLLTISAIATVLVFGFMLI